MRSIWKGTISFGLVSIPVSLYPATRPEELKFRLLRASDLSPVNYKRVAEADGKEVPWDQIVKGYVLLRQALADAGKIAIAKAVSKTRQHLAALKPQEKGIILEVMRFPEELLDASAFKLPLEKAASAAEINMARKLVESMTVKWNPEVFHEDNRELLEKVIEKKIQDGEKNAPKKTKQRATAGVIDLVSILQQSVAEAQKKPVRSKIKANSKAA
jgi:DNA end-binding protein Ku